MRQTVEWSLEWIETPGVPLSYRVEKMRLSKDKTALAVNPSLTLAGIPPETFRYRLGNRSALEWVIDQYQLSEDKRSGTRSDPQPIRRPRIHHAPRRPSRHRSWSNSLCPEPKLSEEFRQIDQSFSLAALGRAQRLSGILAVEQALQACRDGFRQARSIRIGSHVDFDRRTHNHLSCEKR